MNKNKKRPELFKEINEECRELAFIKTGNKKVFFGGLLYTGKIKRFWLNFFGFSSLGEMTGEELTNFLLFLQSKEKADYKSKKFNS